MEATIIEFLLGLVAGTVSGLLIVKRMGRSMPLPKATGSRKLAGTKPRTTLRQAKTRSAKPRSMRRLRPLVQPTETIGVEPSVTTLAVNVSSCPTCGLEAPEALMAEHFLGSPFHENGAPKSVVIMTEDAISDKTETASAEEDEKSSLRHLLQMLVPPRAFGRRHQQRTVNPLSRLVQTLGDAQNALVQPLNGPK